MRHSVCACLCLWKIVSEQRGTHKQRADNWNQGIYTRLLASIWRESTRSCILLFNWVVQCACSLGLVQLIPAPSEKTIEWIFLDRARTVSGKRQTMYRNNLITIVSQLRRLLVMNTNEYKWSIHLIRVRLLCTDRTGESKITSDFKEVKWWIYLAGASVVIARRDILVPHWQWGLFRGISDAAANKDTSDVGVDSPEDWRGVVKRGHVWHWQHRGTGLATLAQAEGLVIATALRSSCRRTLAH